MCRAARISLNARKITLVSQAISSVQGTLSVATAAMKLIVVSENVYGYVLFSSINLWFAEEFQVRKGEGESNEKLVGVIGIGSYIC